MLVTFHQECVTEILATLRLGMTAFFNENELYTEPLVQRRKQTILSTYGHKARLA